MPSCIRGPCARPRRSRAAFLSCVSKRAILRAGCSVLLQDARLSCGAQVVGMKPARNETYQVNRELGILVIEPHGIGRRG